MDQLQVQTGNERLKRLMLSLAKPEKWKATEELAAASLRAYAADERLARVDTVIIIGHGTSLATAMNAEFLFSRARERPPERYRRISSAVTRGIISSGRSGPL